MSLRLVSDLGRVECLTGIEEPIVEFSLLILGLASEAAGGSMDPFARNEDAT